MKGSYVELYFATYRCGRGREALRELQSLQEAACCIRNSAGLGGRHSGF